MIFLTKDEKNIRERLVKLANEKSTIGYQKLSDLCKLGLQMGNPPDRNRISEMLDHITEFEFHDHKRPLLSAIVVHSNTNNDQGEGFFSLCKEKLGFERVDLSDKEKFSNARIDECHHYWSKEINFLRYNILK